jgi:hypothetical protein
MRVAKKATAAQAIGKLEHNTDTFILTYGQFSLIDALLVVLDQTGPAHVAVSTWTAAHAHLERSAELMATAEILSFRMIVDRSFQTRQPKYYEQMVELFGPESIRAINTHAKFITVRNAEWNVVIRTSMNLNENPRLENLEVSDNFEFAEFFSRIVADVFMEVAPNINEWKQPHLFNMEESVTFPLIEAKHIKRNTLNEIEYTHELGSDGACNQFN